MNIYDQYKTKSLFISLNKQNITKIFTKEFIEVINYIHPLDKIDRNIPKSLSEYIIKIADREHYKFPYRHYIKVSIVDTEQLPDDDTDYDTESAILKVILNEKFDKKFDSIMDYFYTQLFEIFHEFPFIDITDINPDEENKILHFKLYYENLTIQVSIRLELYYEITFSDGTNTYEDQSLSDLRNYLYDNLRLSDRLHTIYNKKRIILDKLYKRFQSPLDMEHNKIYITRNKRKHYIGDFKPEFYTAASLIDNQYENLREAVLRLFYTNDFSERYFNLEFFSDGVWIRQPESATSGTNYAVQMPDGFYTIAHSSGIDSAYLIYNDYFFKLHSQANLLHNTKEHSFFCTNCHQIKPIKELADQQFSGYYCMECTPQYHPPQRAEKNKKSESNRKK